MENTLVFHRRKGTFEHAHRRIVYRLAEHPKDFIPNREWYSAKEVEKFRSKWKIIIRDTRPKPFMFGWYYPDDQDKLAPSHYRENRVIVLGEGE